MIPSVCFWLLFSVNFNMGPKEVLLKVKEANHLAWKKKKNHYQRDSKNIREGQINSWDIGNSTEDKTTEDNFTVSLFKSRIKRIAIMNENTQDFNKIK